MIDQDALRERLLEIADDTNWPGYLRAEAKIVAHDPSDLEVPDLTAETLAAALDARVLAREDRPTAPDDLESLRRLLDPL
jgi:hypothetical protein